METKIKEIKDDRRIDEEDIRGGKKTTKLQIKKTTLSYIKVWIIRAGNDKTMIQYLLEEIGDWKH